MTPEQAWQAALDQLRMEMPQPTFNQYVAPITLVAAADQVFRAAAPDQERLEWLKARIATRLARSLSGMLGADQQVVFLLQPEIEFSENLPDAPLVLEAEPLRLSLTDLLVQPERVLVIPGYLRRWVPFLGANLFLVLVGLRQAMCLAAGRLVEGNQSQAITVAEIARWSGLAERTIWNLLDDGRLEWFLKKDTGPDWEINPQTGRAKKRANRYRLIASTPLTPMDADGLQAWLVANGIQNDPVETLQLALATPAALILPLLPEISAEHRHARPTP